VRRAAIASALLLSAALHSPPSLAARAYVEPEGVPTAKLRIVQQEPLAYYVFVSAYDPTACKLSAGIGWLSGGRKVDAERLDMPESQPPKEGIVERKVAAGTPIAFAPSLMVPHVSFLQGVGAALFPLGASGDSIRNAATRLCPAPVFTPVAGENYELQLRPVPGECTARLYRLGVDAAGAAVREEIQGQALTFEGSAKKPTCPLPASGRAIP
jgi:hypothetical protein